MFIGHYGPALAAKPLQKTIPLWLLFVAVQWMDFCWSVLVLLGVEKARVVPGFTQGSMLDLYFMPYTHGLLGAALLALSFGLIAALFFKARKGLTIAILAGAVFSHWLLDLVVHVPDLPLVGDHMKVGFGLWRHVAISLPLELLLLVGGAFTYARSMPSPRGRVALWAFVAFMAVFQVYANFGPPPASSQIEAISALAAYTVLALMAAGVEALRRPK
jgi:hypothetical protein